MFDLHINFSSELTTFPSLVCYFILNMSHLRQILKKALLTFIGNVVKIHKETPKFLELLILQVSVLESDTLIIVQKLFTCVCGPVEIRKPGAKEETCKCVGTLVRIVSLKLSEVDFTHRL